MTDSELPEFIDQDVLRDVSEVEVPDESFLRCFQQTNKPFLSTSAFAEITGLSEQGARNRLESLVKRGLLVDHEAGKQTKIYWLNDPNSKWPVPNDLSGEFADADKEVGESVSKINSLSTFVVYFGGLFAGLHILEWMSTLQATEGVFEVSLSPGVMPALAFVLLAVVFYIALQTSMLVENEDAGWPTLRRMYRQLTT